MAGKKAVPENNKLDQLVAGSLQQREKREQGYREQALKMYPWICGRCQREFTRVTVQQLTVHHRDHNHDHNPSDGSNWELLCVYCHDNEHQRQLEAGHQTATPAGREELPHATHNPFSSLKDLLEK